MRLSSRLVPLALALAASACAGGSSAPAGAPAPAVAGTACRDVARRALSQPTQRVDVMPQPVSQDPPILRGPFPRGVIGKGGYAEVHVSVVIDTLGRPLMRTFNVEKASHPWLAENVRKSIRRWRFTPAELSGCKVPRAYRVDAKSGGR